MIGNFIAKLSGDGLADPRIRPAVFDHDHLWVSAVPLQGQRASNRSTQIVGAIVNGNCIRGVFRIGLGDRSRLHRGPGFPAIGAQITSAKVRSVFRKYQMPLASRIVMVRSERRRLCCGKGLRPCDTDQRKPSITPTIGLKS